MSSSTKELEDRARFLRNAAPREFGDFCAAFANYTQFSVDFLVNTTGSIELAQGRTQQCLKILRVLEEIKNG